MIAGETEYNRPLHTLTAQTHALSCLEVREVEVDWLAGRQGEEDVEYKLCHARRNFERRNITPTSRACHMLNRLNA